MYTVYKHLNNEEEIIYIGKSKSLLHRQRQHSKNSEWFDEIDSIEYCVLDSKIEMDIVELYLINTLNPKYNKKDKREDKFGTVNISELNWLEFDMSELDSVKNNIKNLAYDYEKFISENINKDMLFSVIGNLNELFVVDDISIERKLVRNRLLNKVCNFSEIIIYEPTPQEFYEGDFLKYRCLYCEENFDFVLKNKAKNTKVCYFEGTWYDVVIGLKGLKSNKHEDIKWDY